MTSPTPASPRPAAPALIARFARLVSGAFRRQRASSPTLAYQNCRTEKANAWVMFPWGLSQEKPHQNHAGVDSAAT